MMNTLIDPNDNDMWIDAINGKFFGGKPFTKREWDQLLGHCQVRLPALVQARRTPAYIPQKAVCDFPACAFGPELIAAYPDAKVVLTNRNVDSWYESCRGTIRNSMTSPLLWAMSFFDVDVIGKWSPMTRALFKGVFDDDFERNARNVFRDQYESVRALVPKDQLLEYQVGEGWDRLCDFLDVPVPQFAYPHTNEAAAFRERSWLRFKLSFVRGLPRIAMTVLAAAVVFSWVFWLVRNF